MEKVEIIQPINQSLKVNTLPDLFSPQEKDDFNYDYINKILDTLNIGIVIFNTNSVLINCNSLICNQATDYDNSTSEDNFNNTTSIVNFDEFLNERSLENFSIHSSKPQIVDEDLANITSKISVTNLSAEDSKVKNYVEFVLSGLIEDQKSSGINRNKKRFVNFMELIEHLKCDGGGEKFDNLGIAKILLMGETRYLELRVRINVTAQNLEFLIIDVTKIKEAELIRSQMKYKSLGLAKVAHDFKNPIFSILSLLDGKIPGEINERIDERNSEFITSESESKHYGLEFIKRSTSKRARTQKIDSKSYLNVDKSFTQHVCKSNSLHLVQNLCNYILILIEDFNSFAKIDIEGIATFSKPSQEKIQMKEVIIKPLLEFCTNIFKIRQKYENKEEIKIELVIDKDVPKYVMTNEVKLKQVVVNLVSNAYKFCLNGRITLSARVVTLDEKNTIRISVTDSGIGMTIEEQRDLFNPFRMLESGKDFNKVGTGLGLLIIKDILSKMGSKINLESEKDKGSHFWLI